jgi:hypothetical protein
MRLPWRLKVPTTTCRSNLSQVNIHQKIKWLSPGREFRWTVVKAHVQADCFGIRRVADQIELAGQYCPGAIFQDKSGCLSYSNRPTFGSPSPV